MGKRVAYKVAVAPRTAKETVTLREALQELAEAHQNLALALTALARTIR